MLNICPSCHAILRSRLRSAIVRLQASRRTFNSQSSSIYWDTNPPIDRELAAARWFFQQHPPRKAWTATEWRKNNAHESELLVPEVAFLGRSNVGKSSLLNAILGVKNLNWVGDRPGKTRVLHAWALAATDPKKGGALKGWNGLTDTRLTVLDAPGYGYGSDRAWGEEIVTYLKRRRQLRRIFLLIDAVHGPKKQDQQMLRMLREFNIPHQLVMSKIDRQKNLEASLESLQEVAQPLASPSLVGLGEIVAVGGLDGSVKAKPRGVEDVQWAILRAAGLEEFTMKHFHRKLGDDVHKWSDAPRLPNVESHIPKASQVLAPSPIRTANEVTVERALQRERPWRFNDIEASELWLGDTAEAAANFATDAVTGADDILDSQIKHETAPQQQANPNVYQGMNAFAEATGNVGRSAAKARTRAERMRSMRQRMR
jgi:GTP-binding protein